MGCLFVLFVSVMSLGFAVNFLFPRVMLSPFVALSPMVVLRGRGRCGMRVSDLSV